MHVFEIDGSGTADLRPGWIEMAYGQPVICHRSVQHRILRPEQRLVGSRVYNGSLIDVDQDGHFIIHRHLPVAGRQFQHIRAGSRKGSRCIGLIGRTDDHTRGAAHLAPSHGKNAAFRQPVVDNRSVERNGVLRPLGYSIRTGIHGRRLVPRSGQRFHEHVVGSRQLAVSCRQYESVGSGRGEKSPGDGRGIVGERHSARSAGGVPKQACYSVRPSVVINGAVQRRGIRPDHFDIVARLDNRRVIDRPRGGFPAHVVDIERARTRGRDSEQPIHVRQADRRGEVCDGQGNLLPLVCGGSNAYGTLNAHGPFEFHTHRDGGLQPELQIPVGEKTQIDQLRHAGFFAIDPPAIRRG